MAEYDSKAMAKFGTTLTALAHMIDQQQGIINRYINALMAHASTDEMAKAASKAHDTIESLNDEYSRIMIAIS